MSSVPATVGVLGGGRMGAGIAHAFCLAGSRVSVIEANAEAVRMARARVLASLLTSVERQSTEEPLEELTARVGFSVDVSTLARSELVIEAVPESLELKVDALSRAEAVLDSSAWLASNTSSISITTLGQGLRRTERFCGMHFFNPVPMSKLVEIVVGEHTSSELVTHAEEWVDALGKSAITVKDVPGFATSRLGLALGLEAIRMLEDGVASAVDIDAAMDLGYGHPMGPLKLTDVVGLDVRLGIAEYLQATLGSRFSPPQLLRDMVERGELGRKSGRGFYDWPQDGNT